MLDLPIGKNAPKQVNAIIETPLGSKNKYEYDAKVNLIRMNRTIHAAFQYPINYGFIPQTLANDGDCLDIAVFSENPIYPGVIVEVNPIGMIKLTDSGKEDNKILAVAIGDPIYGNITDLSKMQKGLIKEIQHFFEHYKDLESKKVKIHGFSGVLDAQKHIKRAIDAYKTKRK